MILREIIQRIQSAYSKGVQSDDSRLSNRHIYNKLSTARHYLLDRLLKSKKFISSWNYYTIPCAEVIETSYNEQCTCIPEFGCKLYRTKYPLPKPMMGLSGHKIKSITTIDNKTQIDYISQQQAKYLKGNKYTKKTIKYFIENGYVYFTSPFGLKVVKITFIPEDIVEAKKFKNYCDSNSLIPSTQICDSILDMEFSIDSALLEPLIQMTYEELVTGFSQARPDIDNDSLDTSLNPSRMSPKEINTQQRQEQEQE